MIHSTLKNVCGRSLGLALVLGAAGVLQAADEKLPKAETVLDKYVEATGGKASYAKLTNRVAKGTLEVVGVGLKFSVTLYLASPDKSYTVLESPELGKSEKGTDGQVAWEMSVMMGPQLKEGEERAVMMRAATFDGVVNWRKLFKQAECVGVEDVDGRPCYKVVMTPHEGPAETRYYDTKSNLLMKTAITLKLPAGEIPIEGYVSDYRTVDGVLLPHKARQVIGGMQETLLVMEKIEHNVDLPKDRFKLPAEIQALVEQQEKAQGAKPEQP